MTVGECIQWQRVSVRKRGSAIVAVTVAVIEITSNSPFTRNMLRTHYTELITAILRRWVFVCLIFALPLCGFASAIDALLGAQHFHLTRSVLAMEVDAPPAAAAIFEPEDSLFQPARKPLFAHTAAADAEQAQAHAHAHDSIQRHRHDHSVADSSVVALDGGTTYDAARAELDTASAKAGASLLPLLGWTHALGLSDANAAHSPWGEAPRWSVQSAELRASERPPKT